jgi:hypothetical protein
MALDIGMQREVERILALRQHVIVLPFERRQLV